MELLGRATGDDLPNKEDQQKGRGIRDVNNIRHGHNYFGRGKIDREVILHLCQWLAPSVHATLQRGRVKTSIYRRKEGCLTATRQAASMVKQAASHQKRHECLQPWYGPVQLCWQSASSLPRGIVMVCGEPMTVPIARPPLPSASRL